LGNHIDAKISPKMLQRRHRQWSLKIDTFIQGLTFLELSLYQCVCETKLKKVQYPQQLMYVSSHVSLNFFALKKCPCCISAIARN